MEGGIISSLLKPHFWFARKRYCIVKADVNDIVNTVLAKPKVAFDYHYISGSNATCLDAFDRVSMELSEFVPSVELMVIRKALRSGSTLVIVTNRCSREIAACRVCYDGPAERRIIALRNDELYVGNMYTRPKYRGMSLQAITLQRGLDRLRTRGTIKRTAVAIVNPDNRASMRGLAKVGFGETGWLVEQRIFRFARIICGSDNGQRFCRLVFGNPI